MRVAVVGYGLAGSAFHAPIIAATPGMTVSAIVTANPERAARAAKEHPGARVVASADDLWALADPPRLAVIATPNRSHAPLARAAIAAGVPVVVDKPLAPTAAEAGALVRDARAAGVPLTVFHNRRWDGDFLTLRRLLETGALGAVHRFESRFERWRPEPRSGWRERGDPAEGGGVLLDLGPHLVDQALALFGPVAEVYAEIQRRRPGAAVDDDAFVALTHASGVRSHLWMSLATAHGGPRLRVLGSRAAYVKDGMDVQEDALRAGAVPGEGWGEEPMAAWGRLGADATWTPVRTETGDYRRFYAGVRDALRDGTPPPVDPLDAVAGLAVLEAARRSGETGAVVRPG